MAPAPVNKAAQGSWGVILLIYGIGVLGATTVSQAITVARDIAAFFAAAPQQAGWIISTPSALVAIGALFGGWLVDRWGDKPVLLAGCAIVIIGDIGVVAAGTMENFLAMRAIEGMGFVGISVAAVTILMRATNGATRTSALALWSSYIPMSFALPLVLTAKLAGTGAWRLAFSGHAIVLAIFTLLAVFILPAREGDKGPKRTVGIGTVLRSPGPYLLGLSFATGAFVQTGIVSTLSHSLTTFYGVSFPLASSIGTLGMVFNTIGALLVGPLLNRGVKPMAITIAGVLGMITCGILVGLQLPAFGVAVLSASVFFFASGLIVGLWALLPMVAPARDTMGATSGLVTQVTLLGVLFGPPAAFAAQASGDWTHQAMNVLVACIGCLMLVWLVLTKFSHAPVRTGVNESAQATH